MNRRLLIAGAYGLLFAASLALLSARANMIVGRAGAPPFSCSSSTSVWNPSDILNGTLSNSNCTDTAGSAGSFNSIVRSHSTTYSPGAAHKIYFELQVTTLSSSGFWIGGVGDTGATLSSGIFPGGAGFQGFGLQTQSGSSQFYTNGGATTLMVPNCVATSGTWIGIAVSLPGDESGKAWCTINGTVWNTGGTDSPVTPVGGISNSSLLGAVLAVAWSAGQSSAVTINTGPTGFQYTVPSGYSAFASLGDKHQYAGDISRLH